MKKIYTAILIHLVFCMGIFSQVKVWDKLYLPEDLSGMSLPVSQTTDSEGNLFITGYEWIGSKKFTITYKISWRGEIEWVNKYSGKDSLDSVPKQISFDKDSNLVVLGYIITNETGKDIILLKYNRKGDLLWQKSYSSEGYLSDNPKSFVTDDNSNIYVVEETTISSSVQEINIIKFNSLADEVWIRQYESGLRAGENIRRIFLRNDSIISIGMYGGTGILYLCYDINGNPVNTFTYTFNRISDYTIDNDGNVYFVGSVPWTVVKILSNGSKDWEREVYPSLWSNESALNLIFLKNNNLLVTGNGSEFTGHSIARYFKLIELNNQGDILQDKTIGGTYQTYKDGYFNDSGNNLSFVAYNPTIYPYINFIVKISSDYEVVWKYLISNSTIYPYVSTSPLLISRLNDSNIYVTSKLGNEVANHTIISRITEQIDFISNMVIDFPANGEILFDSSATLKWDKLDPNYSYRVLISKDSLDFENQIVLDEVTNENYFNFKRQEDWTKYYWEVFGFNQYALTHPSDIKFFRLGAKLHLLNPVNGSIIYNDDTAKFFWNSFPDITYRLQISSDIAFGDSLIKDTLLNNNNALIKINYPGLYYWRVGVDLKNGNFDYSNYYEFTVMEPEVSEIPPASFVLEQNYPNPFNNRTLINYSIPESDNLSRVLIKVFNSLGEEIKTVLDEYKPPGKYVLAVFDTELASGVYYYQLRSSTVVITKKMVLMK